MSGVRATARSLQTSMSANVTSTAGPSTSPWMSAENANVSLGHGLIAECQCHGCPQQLLADRAQSLERRREVPRAGVPDADGVADGPDLQHGQPVRQRCGQHAPPLHRLGHRAVPLRPARPVARSFPVTVETVITGPVTTSPSRSAAWRHESGVDGVAVVGPAELPHGEKPLGGAGAEVRRDQVGRDDHVTDGGRSREAAADPEGQHQREVPDGQCGAPWRLLLPRGRCR